ncbi:MAG: adenylosuccinate synthetase [Opitutales bacterium]|nr:adenylosuccinate synthetase [Opitutales bacterium]
MAKPAFSSQIILDTGISMGDEGKGRLIPEIIHELQQSTGKSNPVSTVIKVNGGANSGHTSGGLKLNLYPAGVVEESVATLAIGSGVVADPHKFVWEGAYIEKHGYSVKERLLIDERTMVSDLSHRLLDLGWEHYRTHVIGEEARGSTGRGISPAYCDETAHFPIFYADFTNGRAAFERKLRQRMSRALLTLQAVCQVDEASWNGFFQTLTQAETRAHKELIDAGILPAEAFNFERFKGSKPFTLDMDALVEAYWTAGQMLKPNIGDVREHILQTIAAGHTVIGEFGQAFWLDKRFGFPPNVTASHTLPGEFYVSAGVPVQPVHTVGVCKAYDTKVGTHHFICRFPTDHPLGQKLSKIEFGVTTGRQRMVGWFDAVEKGDALRYGGFQDLCINKLDALSYSGDWNSGNLLVCTSYEDSDGSIVRHVPRSTAQHTRVKPIYTEVPGWSEDISGIRNYTDLPENAQRYVRVMVRSTLEVAYGADTAVWPKALPNLRYIGVGPEPDQIISDIPETRELLGLA